MSGPYAGIRRWDRLPLYASIAHARGVHSCNRRCASLPDPAGRVSFEAFLCAKGDNKKTAKLERAKCPDIGEELARDLLENQARVKTRPDTIRAPDGTTMKIKIRIPKNLFETAKNDLRQEHPHAAERVGFFFGKLVPGTVPIILLTEYLPVADTNYIRDRHVGARINSAAIREAMQKGMSESLGVFHVHFHELGAAGFSGIDRHETTRLIPSLQAVSPEQAHGAFVQAEGGIASLIWLPGEIKPVATALVSVVGWPMLFFQGCTYGQ